MTDKQKEAIELLNSLGLDKDKYFLLLEFIMQSTRIEYVPYIQQTEPLNPYYYSWKPTTKDM